MGPLAQSNRHYELRRDVPSGLIEDEDRVSAVIDCLADFQQIHGVGIATGQYEARALTLLGADGTENVRPHRPLIQWR